MGEVAENVTAARVADTATGFPREILKLCWGFSWILYVPGCTPTTRLKAGIIDVFGEAALSGETWEVNWITDQTRISESLDERESCRRHILPSSRCVYAIWTRNLSLIR